MKFPQIKLSTLIVLNLLAAGLLWLNVKEAVLARNELIMPLGWPNDAVMVFQEKWHEQRAAEGFSPQWGYVLSAALACNIVLAFSGLGFAYLLMERRSIRWSRPQRNTWWILAAVISILLAANSVNHMDTIEDMGFGQPFRAVFRIEWDMGANDLRVTWHLLYANLIADVCIAVWILLGTYAVCQKAFARRNKGAPVSLPAEKKAQSAV